MRTVPARLSARLLAAAVLAVAAGCAAFDEALPDPLTGVDGETAFAQLERVLLEDRPVRVELSVVAEGAVEADLSGALLLERGGRARVDVSGSFQGEPVVLQLVSDGVRMVGGVSDRRFDLPTPRALREGLVLGFTRMGILHNLAVLTGGRPPDATDGTARTWLTVTNHGRGAVEGLRGRSVVPVTFDLAVGGQPAAQPTLYLEAHSGLPVERRQTVQFPGGEMRVVERYPRVALDARLPPELFVLEE